MLFFILNKILWALYDSFTLQRIFEAMKKMLLKGKFVSFLKCKNMIQCSNSGIAS